MTKKLCPVCNEQEATYNPTLGILPCSSCHERRSKTRTSGKVVEFTSEGVKEDRKKFAKDILQPFRSGELSKEFIDQYGTEGINVNKEEIKHAVNTTDSYYG